MNQNNQHSTGHLKLKNRLLLEPLDSSDNTPILNKIYIK
jgi:hypothetical protein